MAWKWMAWALGMSVLLTGCANAGALSAAVAVTQKEEAEQVQPETETEPEQKTNYEELLAASPVAQIEGDVLSPDGRFEVRTEGASDIYVSGERVPERVQVVNAESGAVCWEMDGAIGLSALWAPDGSCLALRYGGRTWQAVAFIETETWTQWDAHFPEYTFLTQDWRWMDAATLRLAADSGEISDMQFYRCNVWMEDGNLTGELVSAAEPMEGEYDFDHDGAAERVTLVGNGDSLEESSFWLVQLWENGQVVWTDYAASSHAGWNSIFAVKVDGKDYLLRYLPYMGQGFCTYDYKLFSLDGDGNESVLKENRVEFDINFGSEFHQGFDPAAIAAFLQEVHGYLDEGTVLLSTDGGDFSANVSGADFWEQDACFWDEYCPYDESRTLEENLRAYQDFQLEIRGL